MVWKSIHMRQCAALILAACICLASVLDGPSGEVLCIGTDGHMAIESRTNDCCGLPRDQHDEEDMTSEEECGTCFDVPLDRFNANISSRANSSPADTGSTVPTNQFAAVAVASSARLNNAVGSIPHPTFSPDTGVPLLL